jgi:hypothetical protein
VLLVGLEELHDDSWTVLGHGVRLRPRAVRASTRTICFSDASELEAGAVIWATGFRHYHSWLDAPIFDYRHRLVHLAV